ncbi:hypothetical protein Tco_0442035 [Tanacetum coccineum]
MARSLHSHLQVLSKEDLKGTHIEHGFKRAFMSLLGQDDDIFTSTIQFQKFIDSQFTLDYDSQITDKYFAEYTGIETQENKVDTSKALDANLVVMESSGTKSGKQDTSQGVMQLLIMHISNPYMTKSQWLSTKGVSTASTRWKPTGRILKTVGLRWVPKRKIFASCTSKDDNDSTHGSNVDISKIRKCKQRFYLSAGKSNNVKKDNLKVWLLKKLISQKPVLKWVQN